MQNQYEIELVGDLRTEVIHSATDSKIITDAPLDNKGKGRTFSPTDLLAVPLDHAWLQQWELQLINLELN